MTWTSVVPAPEHGVTAEDDREALALLDEVDMAGPGATAGARNSPMELLVRKMVDLQSEIIEMASGLEQEKSQLLEDVVRLRQAAASGELAGGTPLPGLAGDEKLTTEAAGLLFMPTRPPVLGSPVAPAQGPAAAPAVALKGSGGAGKVAVRGSPSCSGVLMDPGLSTPKSPSGDQSRACTLQLNDLRSAHQAPAVCSPNEPADNVGSQSFSGALLLATPAGSSVPGQVSPYVSATVAAETDVVSPAQPVEADPMRTPRLERESQILQSNHMDFFSQRFAERESRDRLHGVIEDMDSDESEDPRDLFKNDAPRRSMMSYFIPAAIRKVPVHSAWADGNGDQARQPQALGPLKQPQSGKVPCETSDTAAGTVASPWSKKGRREMMPRTTTGTMSRMFSEGGARYNQASQTGGLIDKLFRGKGNPFSHYTPTAVRRKVEGVLYRPELDDDRFLHKTGICQAISRSPAFEFLTLIMISLNALWMSIDIDHNTADAMIDAEPAFQAVENIFCMYFLAELLIRLLAFNGKRHAFTDKWFVFDSFLLLLMVGETWIFTLVIWIGRETSGGKVTTNNAIFSNASVLRMARLIRLTRIGRMAKLLRSMPEVMVILRAMLTATRTVIITLCLLGLIIYVFAIGFCNLTKDTKLGDEYFRNVRTGMLTLFITGAFPDVWDIVQDVAAQHWALWIVLLSFLLLSTVTVMNMMIGVLVEVVNGASRVERETMEAALIRETFMTCLKSIGNTEQLPSEIKLEKEEFLDLIKMPLIRKALVATNVDLASLVDLADFIYRNKSYVRLTKLMETCLQLRSTNRATVKDLIDVRRYITCELEWLGKQILSSQGVASPSGVFHNRTSGIFPGMSRETRRHS